MPNRKQHLPPPSIERPPDEDVARRLDVILAAFLVASAIITSVGAVTDNPQAVWTAGTGGLATLVSVALRRSGCVQAAVLFLLLSMIASVTVSLSLGHGVHDSAMILYPTIIVVGSVLLTPRNYVGLVGVVLASVAGVFWIDWTGRLRSPLPGLTDVSDLVAIVTVLIVQAVTVEVLAISLFRSLAAARAEAVERRAAEAEVRRLNAELERRVEERTAELADANEELEAFSYSVSHDLRRPLRAAEGYAELLEEEQSSDWTGEARELLSRIRTSNRRMNRLIDELLAFSRIGRREVERQAVDTEAMVRGIADSLKASFPSRSVEWSIAALPPSWADPVLLEQIWENLLGNAFKYTGRNAEAHIEVGYGADGDQRGWFVRDDGVGFDMARGEMLFQPFERLHRDTDFEGTGIGLATVKRIVERHGGHVWYRSAPGQGATFGFHLPPS